MTHVECPFCDREVAIDPAAPAFGCEACGARAEFAPETAGDAELALAA